MVACTGAQYNVTGIDVDPLRVDRINAGRSHIEDVGNETLSPLVREKKITATIDYGAVAALDIIIVCVPTPLNKNREPELGPLEAAVHSLAKHMSGEQLVILQSTSFPGTTEELVLPQLEAGGLRAGKDFYLAFSPERIDPGNGQYFISNTPKVVGGVTPQCARIATQFLSTFVEKVVPVSSPRVAELTKLLENTFRSVNIALVSELSELGQRMGVDFWEVIHAAATKPFGYMPFYPGIGVGGHCTPVDPWYLSWKAREYDFYVSFIELAARTNDNRPYYVVSRIADTLGDIGRTLKGARLLLLGMSFKSNVGDARNSPAVRVAELLADKGAEIVYSDPYVPQVTIGGSDMTSVELNETMLRQHDAAVLLVNHSSFDIEKIVAHSKLVIDTGDATRQLGPRPTVVKL